MNCKPGDLLEMMVNSFRRKRIFSTAQVKYIYFSCRIPNCEIPTFRWRVGIFLLFRTIATGTRRLPQGRIKEKGGEER